MHSRVIGDPPERRLASGVPRTSRLTSARLPLRWVRG